MRFTLFIFILVTFLFFSSWGHEIIGFLKGNIYKEGYRPPYQYLTHIAWFGMTETQKGEIVDDEEWDPHLIEEAHAHNVRVLLTLEDVNAKKPLSLTEDVAEQVWRVCQEREADGVMLDLEHTGRNIKDFILFLRARRVKYISICLPPNPGLMRFKWKELVDLVDSFFIMAYPYYPYIVSATEYLTGPVSPLEGSALNVRRTVDFFLKRLYGNKERDLKRKFILGLPLFGAEWVTGLTEPTRKQPFVVVLSKTKRPVRPTEDQIKNILKEAQQHVVYFEPKTKTKWFKKKEGDTWYQYWYDDAETLALKFNLVNEKDLRGVGFWALGFEGENYEIFAFLSTVAVPSTVVEKGLNWLREQQNDDGSWTYSGRITEENVGTTSMALAAFLNYGVSRDDPVVTKALSWILSHLQEDGSITTGSYPVYDTSLAILALIATGDMADYYDIIKAGAQYLIEVQNDEDEGYDETNRFYGGWGYPRDNWADLSNTQFALLALHYAEEADPTEKIVPDSVWQKASIFLRRCQNEDGGFSYQPGGDSYGSMTCAGLWGLYSCNFNTNSEEVRKAWNWIESHYSIEQNFPHGTWVYYYYIYSFAKACMLWGREKVIEHDWYLEMQRHLVNNQTSEGYWPGTDPEEEPDLVATCWALLALETKPTTTKETSLRVTVSSPVDLHVYDMKGRHVGLDYETGEVEIGIPGASYSGPGTEPQVITVPHPEGTYRIEMVGRESGPYTLEIEGLLEGTSVFSRTFEGIISEGGCDVAKAVVSGIAGPITVDVKPPKPVPSGLRAEAGDSSVRLTWDMYTADGFDTVGYNVYRSEEKWKGYVRINTEVVGGTTYIDEEVKNSFIYYYAVTAISATGEETELSRPVKALPLPSGAGLIVGEVLNYPNPCYSGTTFTYILSKEAHVRIEIYNLAGELLRVIDPASGTAGYNEEYWDGTDDRGFLLDNGVYIYCLIAEVDGQVAKANGKLVILR